MKPNEKPLLPALTVFWSIFKKLAPLIGINSGIIFFFFMIMMLVAFAGGGLVDHWNDSDIILNLTFFVCLICILLYPFYVIATIILSFYNPRNWDVIKMAVWPVFLIAFMGISILILLILALAKADLFIKIPVLISLWGIFLIFSIRYFSKKKKI